MLGVGIILRHSVKAIGLERRKSVIWNLLLFPSSPEQNNNNKGCYYSRQPSEKQGAEFIIITKLLSDDASIVRECNVKGNTISQGLSPRLYVSGASMTTVERNVRHQMSTVGYSTHIHTRGQQGVRVTCCQVTIRPSPSFLIAFRWVFNARLALILVHDGRKWRMKNCVGTEFFVFGNGDGSGVRPSGD